ncbi:hypothetical protein COBT_001026 [Conglomerata obtusa]
MKSGKFTSLPITKALARSLPVLTTPIQRKTIPKIISGCNVTAIARTGSGKTYAYLVPIIEKCLNSDVRCVVLVPTRELALQVGKVLRELVKNLEGKDRKRSEQTVINRDASNENSHCGDVNSDTCENRDMNAGKQKISNGKSINIVHDEAIENTKYNDKNESSSDTGFLNDKENRKLKEINSDSGTSHDYLPLKKNKKAKKSKDDRECYSENSSESLINKKSKKVNESMRDSDNSSDNLINKKNYEKNDKESKKLKESKSNSENFNEKHFNKGNNNVDLSEITVEKSKNIIKKKLKKIKSTIIYGGTSVYKDFEKLSQPFDILIATVGRFRHCLDEMNKKFLFDILCVDEMDRIFDDFIMQKDLLYILDKITYNQKIFFSATLPEKIIPLITDTEIIKIDNEISKTLTNLFFYTRNEIKEKAIIFLLNKYKEKKIIIFCGTKHTVEYISDIINTRHKKIYSSMDQQAREESLGCFLRNKVNILIVTDLACRGLDIKELDVIINYDMCDEKTFLHRVGRVARNGREGISINLVSYSDIYLFYNIRDTYFNDIEIGEIPTEIINEIFIKESEYKQVSERGNIKMEMFRKGIKGVENKDDVSLYKIHSMFKNDINEKKAEFIKNIGKYRKNKCEAESKVRHVEKVDNKVENKADNKIENKNENKFQDQFYIPYNNKENKSSLHFSAYSVPKDENKREKVFERKRKIGEMFKDWEKMKRKNNGNKKIQRKSQN